MLLEQMIAEVRERINEEKRGARNSASMSENEPQLDKEEVIVIRTLLFQLSEGVYITRCYRICVGLTTYFPSSEMSFPSRYLSSIDKHGKATIPS